MQRWMILFLPRISFDRLLRMDRSMLTSLRGAVFALPALFLIGSCGGSSDSAGDRVEAAAWSVDRKDSKAEVGMAVSEAIDANAQALEKRADAIEDAAEDKPAAVKKAAEEEAEALEERADDLRIRKRP
jgi:hypothetical protein